jgi:hypothetical protein
LKIYSISITTSSLLKRFGTAILLLISIIIFSCKAEKTITLANGNKISEKQFRRITNKAYRNSFKKMSIAEKKILFEGVDIKFIYQNSIKIDSTK